MNIFYLSSDPAEAARMMVNRHVVKMIVESAQLLSTAHRVLDGQLFTDVSARGRKQKRFKLEDAREKILYKATHINHPCAKWVRVSVENYNWLFEHFFALGLEYNYRYGKLHKCFQTDLGYMLSSPPLHLNPTGLTAVPCAMDAKYIISDNPVENYRNLYKNGKRHLHAWKRREMPEWME